MTPVIQRLINPPYIPSKSYSRTRDIARSSEMRSLDTVIAGVSPFDKYQKSERAVVEFELIDEGARNDLLTEFTWIPRVVQNSRLLNIGMLYLMSLLRQGCKGTEGFVGGNMNLLLNSLKLHQKDSSKYEVVIILCLKQVPVKESFEKLMLDNDPILKNIAVGLARIDRDEVRDLVLIANGMDFMINARRWTLEPIENAIHPPSTNGKPLCFVEVWKGGECILLEARVSDIRNKS
jgi:hypothetical protein